MSALNVRNLDPDVVARLRVRALVAGTSLEEYVRRLLIRAADRPSPEEVAAMVGRNSHRSPITVEEFAVVDAERRVRLASLTANLR